MVEEAQESKPFVSGYDLEAQEGTGESGEDDLPAIVVPIQAKHFLEEERLGLEDGNYIINVAFDLPPGYLDGLDYAEEGWKYQEALNEHLDVVGEIAEGQYRLSDGKTGPIMSTISHGAIMRSWKGNAGTPSTPAKIMTSQAALIPAITDLTPAQVSELSGADFMLFVNFLGQFYQTVARKRRSRSRSK